MIINRNIDNFDFCPYIDTEKTIIEQLKNNLHSISDDFELMPYPLAHMINTQGLQKTNDFIKTLNSEVRRIFICQHILVNDLNFQSNDIVFTPHASFNDSFFSIPHYAVNYDESKIKENKKFIFSFMGSTQTHYTRKQLTQTFPDFCFNSGQFWGLNSNSEDFKDKYISLLGDTIFSICPRGTGISSVRLFESMAMNSIPVIISDGYKKPLNDKLDWNLFSISISENEIENLSNVIMSISKEKIVQMQTELKKIYKYYFSNKNLSQTILETL